MGRIELNKKKKFTMDMEQKTNYLFGMHPVFEAIAAGKNIEKVLLKKGLGGEQFQQLFGC